MGKDEIKNEIKNEIINFITLSNRSFISILDYLTENYSFPVDFIILSLYLRELYDDGLIDRLDNNEFFIKN